MTQIPVVLLTGFLGAGKTTLLNQMLGYLQGVNEQVALLINEFGTTNIDSQLVERKNQPLYEVNQGSIFCACTRTQFFQALETVASLEPPVHRLIIESTGIAQTSDLSEYMAQCSAASSFQLTHTICLVDATSFHKVFQTLPAVKDQVREASICVINKADRVPEDQLVTLQEMVRDLNASAPIVTASYGNVDFSSLFSTDLSLPRSSAEAQAPPITDVVSCSLSVAGHIDLARLETLLRSHSASLLRVKGIVHTSQGVKLVEWINGDWSAKPHQQPFAQTSQLVLIGANLHERTLQRQLRACKEETDA